MPRFGLDLLGILAASLLLSGCGSAAPTTSSTDLSSVQAVLTATSGQVSPPASGGTPDPAGHATPPADSARPMLGATENVFIASLGTPGPGSAPGSVDHFGRVAGTSCDAFVVTFVGGHARSILRHSCASPVPDIQQRLNESMRFLPPDTAVGKAVETPSGEGTINTSASLAKLLPSDVFQDCASKALAPGTFALIMTSDGWLISSGSCPSAAG